MFMLTFIFFFVFLKNAFTIIFVEKQMRPLDSSPYYYNFFILLFNQRSYINTLFRHIICTILLYTVYDSKSIMLYYVLKFGVKHLNNYCN